MYMYKYVHRKFFVPFLSVFFWVGFFGKRVLYIY